MFAIEVHSGVVPDLVLVAKSMAAGLPLSAVTGRARSWMGRKSVESAAHLEATLSLRGRHGGA